MRNVRRLVGRLVGLSAAHAVDHVGHAGPHGRHARIIVELVELLGHCVEFAFSTGELCFLGALTHLTAPWLAGAALLVL